MPTPSSLPSEVRTTFERPDSVDTLWASILTKATQGIIGPAGLSYFADLFKGTDTRDGVTAFAVAVAEFVAVAAQDERLTKAGSVAGTRGDPIGQIAVHADGSRWRKTGPGQWERAGGGEPEKKEAVGKKGDRDSVRVSVLRARLKELRSRWQGATSTAQRAAVVKQLTDVKRTIRQLTSTGMKKSFSDTEQDQLGALLIKADTLLTDWRTHLNEERVAKGDGYVPPPAVRAAARRGLELRRKHKRGGLDNKEAKKQGVGSGVQRATNLMNGDALSIQTVKRMRAFFSRHAQHGEHRQDKTSAAYISWLLWGGNAGKSWADRIVREYEAKTTRKSMYAHKVTDIIDSYVHPQVQTNMVDDYLRETDAYDLRKSLTAADYIERILRDGGSTAAQARLYMLTHSASALAAHITTTLGKVRSDI